MMLLLYYALFLLAAIVFAVLGCVLWMFNPFPGLFLWIAHPIVRAFGRAGGSGYGWYSALWLVQCFWALTLPPIHFINYQLLQWHHWAYAAELFVAGVVVAFIVLIAKSSRLSRPDDPPCWARGGE